MSAEEIERRPTTAGSRDAIQEGGIQTNSQWPGVNQTSQNSMNGTTGLNNMNHVNGMFPMDFNSMMANSVMPMAGFPNMMGTIIPAYILEKAY